MNVHLNAVVLCLLLGVAAVPETTHAETLLLSGIDKAGKVPALAPSTSILFETIDAGLVRDGANLGFYWVIKPLDPIKRPLYLKITYENPCGESLVNDAVIEPGMEKIGLSSPGYVLGLKKDKPYRFRIEVFQNKGDATSIDTVLQDVISVFEGWGCSGI